MNGESNPPSPEGPTTLDIIYNSQLRMEGKMDGVCEKVSENSVNIEKNNGRLFTHDEKFKQLENHVDDKKAHWNQELADEGAAGYVARNKFKIALITTLTTILTVVGGLIISWFQSLG